MLFEIGLRAFASEREVWKETMPCAPSHHGQLHHAWSPAKIRRLDAAIEENLWRLGFG